MKLLYLLVGWFIVILTATYNFTHHENKVNEFSGKLVYISACNHQPHDAIETLATVFFTSSFNYLQLSGKNSKWKFTSHLSIELHKNPPYFFDTFPSNHKSINLFLLSKSRQSLLEVMRC